MTLDHVVWGIIGILLGLNGWLGNRYINGLEASIKTMAERMDHFERRFEAAESFLPTRRRRIPREDD